MHFTRFVELNKDDFLYKQGDSGSSFYFVMTGKLEVLVKNEASNEFKYSKGIDEADLFGLKKFYNEPRQDYARVISDKVEIIEFVT
jgi:CRP-like cAMP-binding protein